jgi:hypothetical protein
MLGLGAGVGLFGGLASEFLLVSLPESPVMGVGFGRHVRWHTPVPHLYDPAGQPFASAYALYYATLFVGPRWWRQADPYRRSRLRFGTLFGVAVWAWLASVFWEFPHPWAVASALAVSAVVQLSSPWHPQERKSAQRKEVGV